MEKKKLTEGARSKLRALINTSEWSEIRAFLERLAPLSDIDTKCPDPIAIAALTGAQNKGWKRCMRTIEDISDPEYGEKKNL